MATERQPVLAASVPLRKHRDLQDRARRLGARSGALKRRDPYGRAFQTGRASWWFWDAEYACCGGESSGSSDDDEEAEA